MGKFKVKPTRAVAKPFKKASFPQRKVNNDPKESHQRQQLNIKEDDFEDELDSEDEDDKKLDLNLDPKKSKTTIGILSAESGGKISKNRKRKSLKRKSVSFSKNLTEVGKKTGKNASSVVQEIIKSHAAQLVNPGTILKQKGDEGQGSPSNKGEVSLMAPLKKILRKEIKNKKTRIKARREIFKKKLGMIKASEDEMKAAKIRQKTVIVGDMKPIINILDELQEQTKAKIITDTKTRLSAKKKPSKKKKFSVAQRQQDMLDGLSYFQNAGF